MGWTYSTKWVQRKDIIADLTKYWRNRQDAEGTCLKHCYRGNNWSGVLWTVWEIKKPCGETYRYIGCNKLEYSKHEPPSWGVKDLDESMGPFYHSCPLSYLDMVPEVKNQSWRDYVKAWHAERKPKFALRIGQRVKLVDGCNVSEVTITKTKPIQGIGDNRRVYGLKWRNIDKALIQT